MEIENIQQLKWLNSLSSDHGFLAFSIFLINALKLTMNSFFLTLQSMLLLSSQSWKRSCSHYLIETHVFHREQPDKFELTWEEWKASGVRMAWLSLCREQLISCPVSLLLTLVLFLATSPIPSKTGKMPGKPKLLEHLP